MQVALAILLSLPQAVAVTVGTSVASDATGGLLAPSPTSDPRPTMTGSLTPGATLGITSGIYSAGFGYSLRMFRRYELGTVVSPTDPSANAPFQSADRFLVNQSGTLSASMRLSKGWAISASMFLSIGEVDLPTANSSTQQVLGTGTPNTGASPGVVQTPALVNTQPIVGANVLESRTANATFQLSGALTRDLSLDLSSRATYQGSFAPANTVTIVDLPTARSISLDSTWGYQYTKRDSFNITTGTTFSFSERTGDYRSLNLLVGYGRQLGPNSSVTLGVGILHIKTLRVAAFTDPTTMMLTTPTITSKRPVPAFSLSLGTQFLNLKDFKLRGTVGSGISSAVSPNTGALEERGSLMLGLGSNIGTRWTTSVQASFSTPATTTARPALGGAVASTVDDLLRLTETALSSQVQVSYQLSDNFNVSGVFGAATYAPRLVDPAFAFRSPNLTGSLRITMSVAQAL